jgi:hypothetical protein
MTRSVLEIGRGRAAPVISCAVAVAVAVALLAVACGGPSSPLPAEPGILAGTASGWVGATGTVRANLFVVGEEIASGSIAIDGTFSVELPPSLDAELLAPLTFCEGIDISGDANGSAVLWLHVTIGPDTVGTIARRNRPASETPQVGDAMTMWVYADAPIAAHGACMPGEFDLESEAYALDLVAGWNVVTQVVTEVDGEAFTTEYRTTPPPGAFSWRYVPTPAPIAPP